MLVKFVSEKKENWDEYLDTCVYAYNTSVHESTSFSPFEIMYGRRAVLPIDIEMDEIRHTIIYKNCDVKESDTTSIMASLTEQRLEILQIAKENIQKAQKRQKSTYDRKHSSPNAFAVGQLVLRKDFRRKNRAGEKLDTPYIGPYLTTKCHSKGMYRLQLVGDKSSTIERISSAYLKPYKVQHGCIETSARHVYVSNIVPTETFSTENYGSIATAKNSKQEDPQQCQDTYELDKHEAAAADEDDDSALKEQLYSSNLLRLWRTGAWSLKFETKEDDNEFDVSSNL